jgi:DNA-binding PadR family transcriptional regulator
VNPLTPAVFHILLALANGPRHGYAILKDVSLQTDGAFRMGPGTLYGTLQRLMEQGWVEETGGAGDPADERRRYYRLTRGGRRALEAEVERMDMLVRVARAERAVPRPSRS